MQHDDIIWPVINHNFCSYKIRSIRQNFCKNKYNVTGLCNRSACPLANSRYATILEEKGRCYLMIKTIERAHSPLNMWEKILLSRNYPTALQQIDDNLIYWPNFLIHKNKQRLTKIFQYLIRMRKLTRKIRPVKVPINKKIDRREQKREVKALKAARLTNAIEQELLERLKSGLYNSEENQQDILNLDQNIYEKAALKVAQLEGTEQEDPDVVEEKEVEDIKEEEVEREYVADFEPEESDVEDMAFREAFGEGVDAPSSSSSSSSSSSGTNKRKRKNIEIEIEREDLQNENYEIA